MCIRDSCSSALADTATVTARKLILREKASSTSDALQTLPKGTKLEVLGKSGSWYKVTYGKYTGYVYKTYVSVTKTTSSSSSSSSTTRLEKGSTGSDVKELQTKLKKLGYYDAYVDGDYGDTTVAAVKAFQKKYNLTADGVAGSETLKKLDSAYKNANSDKDDDYTLKYVTNGGKVISSETKSRSWVKDYEDLPTPIRSGYRFEGWYYDTRLTDKVTDDVKVNKTVVTLYARWSSSETPGMLNDEDHFAYVQGYSDGSVHPYGLISRAETTTIFFRLLTDEVRDDNLLTSNTYTDVTNDYWANTAISTMTGLGIVQGRSATTFDPKAPITRAQFAAICARFDTGVSSGSRTFSDISGHWAEKYIERAAELSWIQGFADGTFRPDTYITRAQAMTMINHVLNRTPEDEEDLLEGMKVWPDCNPGDWFYLAVQEATNSHDYKDRGGEVWTKLIRDPDWTRYER